MSLSKKEVVHIAELARLSLTPEEVEKYQNELESILIYIDQIQELDLENVSEMQQGSNQINIWRKNEVIDCDNDIKKSIIKSFVHKEGDLLEVQAVFDNQEENI